jgi:hypothetical protein
MPEERKWRIAATSLLVLVFALDCFSIAGYALWLPYLSTILLLSRCPARVVYYFAGGVSLLMAAGYFIPSVGPLPVVATAIDRAAGVAAVWIAAVLLVRSSRALNSTREERNRLESLIETLPAGVVFADPRGRIALANSTAKKAFGGVITGTAFGPQGRYTLKKLDGSPFASDELPLTRALEHGEHTHGLLMRVHYETGGERVLSVDAAPIRFGSRQRAAAVAVLTDVSRRSKAERECERLLGEFQATVQALPDGFIIYNPDTSIRFINGVAQTMLNYRDDDLHRPFERRLQTVIVSDLQGGTVPEADYPFLRALRGEIVRGQILQIRVRNRRYWLSTSAAPIVSVDGTVTGAVMGFSDITGVIALQRSLAESEERFRGLFERHQAPMLLIEPETGHIQDANQAAVGYYGYSRDQFRAMHIQQINQLPPERVAAAMKATVEEGKPYHLFRHRLASGELRWVEVYSSPIHIHDKQVLFSIIHDITERRTAEHRIQRLNEELRERAEELTAANTDLEAFSYSVSHDLRNPLTAIDSLSALLEEDYAGRLDDAGREYLRRIRGGVAKMKSLIEDILSLSRVGRLEMSRHDVDLSGVVSEYLHELHSSRAGREVEFVVQRDIHVVADPALIRIALENLLRNAWKFTARRAVARIEFGCFTEGGQRVYFVKDNGAGFGREYAEVIFEPFRRVHAEREFGGTGVGLSIVRRVIGRHGGRVWAKGEVGEGATFYFTLGEQG